MLNVWFFKSCVKKKVALCEWGHLFWKQAKFDLCIPPYVLPSGCDTAVGKSIQLGWQNVPLDCSQWGMKPCGGWSKTTPEPDAMQPRLLESMEKNLKEQISDPEPNSSCPIIKLEVPLWAHVNPALISHSDEWKSRVRLPTELNSHDGQIRKRRNESES